MSRIDGILNKIFLWKEELTYSEKVYLKEYVEELTPEYKENNNE
tara:strand:+ start:272 stop:403 length:132 start_codon:yes stop_codon:yes gene_type:complete